LRLKEVANNLGLAELAEGQAVDVRAFLSV
jgi:hypothetical protein